MSSAGPSLGPSRPNIMGRRHVVAAGHFLAAQSGLQILEAGGNAVDAGVATGLATNVLEPVYTCLAGVAPIIIYLADTNEVVTISGLGTWPKAASCEYFQRNFGGAIPNGIPRSVVPAALDAWVTALEKYGTMTFGQVAAFATRLAGEGFAVDPHMNYMLTGVVETLRNWPSSQELYLPNGHPPEVGELFVQPDLARTLQFLADEEAAHGKGDRLAGLRAARDAFYRGDIAAAIVEFHRQHDGLLTAEDMAGFRVGIEPPVRTRFDGVDVYGCGPWCQGPMLLQALNLLDGEALRRHGHNSTPYVHTLTEAIKLAAADREAYYGDPRFVDVPMAELLSEKYAKGRRQMIRADEAWPDMPPAGEIGRSAAWVGGVAGAPAGGYQESALDTSYLCVMDERGNAFSATPSDGLTMAPVVPGLGCASSGRGSSSWTDPNHPSSVAPGKRPRLTCNPALAIGKGSIMPFGTPGGDVQTQAMLQVFLNIFVFGMDPQSAVEAPRFATYSFPSSFEPHESHPGRLNLEAAIDGETGEALAGLGHKVEWWPERLYLAGSVCAIRGDTDTGTLWGAADPRRSAYAVGW